MSALAAIHLSPNDSLGVLHGYPSLTLLHEYDTAHYSDHEDNQNYYRKDTYGTG